MTTTLPDFLLQRLDKDEAVARAASAPRWVEVSGLVASADDKVTPNGFTYRPLITPGGSINNDDPLEDGDAAHIARHDPARVLAEVAAKRAIVNLHAEVTGSTAFYGDDIETPHGSPACSTCGTWGEYAEAWPCPTLRYLAQPYADHADYEQAWAL